MIKRERKQSNQGKKSKKHKHSSLCTLITSSMSHSMRATKRFKKRKHKKIWDFRDYLNVDIFCSFFLLAKNFATTRKLSRHKSCSHPCRHCN